MKLKRFLLRYYPPGIILEFEHRDKSRELKEIDLFHLTSQSDVEVLVNQIILEEPLITGNKKPHLRRLIYKLLEKLETSDTSDFCLFKVLRTHLMPLTNCAFNKAGDKFITGSYDRTCKLWDTLTGEELLTFEGHTNVVYTIAFNNPYGDKIATGSFDHTCKVWSSTSGECLCSLEGHTGEIVALAFGSKSGEGGEAESFLSHGSRLCTGSMDGTGRVWDVERGETLSRLVGHTGEVVSVGWGQREGERGSRVVTASFDNTLRVWDVRTGRSEMTLIGHQGEVSSCQVAFSSDLVLSSSTDRSCKVWDLVSGGRCLHTLLGHRDEVLDCCFSPTGGKLASASADGSCRVYSATSGACLSVLEGHQGEVSKLCFNPQGTRVLSASADQTARIWEVETGECLQVLEGHSDEIFSCAFNYEGDTIITGSKDNTCRIWKC